MPEGHTVHRLARAFTDLFGGQALAVTSPQGRFAAGAALVSGRMLVASEAWGKQLFLGFVRPDGGASDGGVAGEADLWLRVHLGLYGAWTFSTDGTAAVVHAIGAPRKRVGERETALASADLSEAEQDLDGPASDDTAAADGLSGPHPAARAADSRPWVVPAPRGAVRVRVLGAHAVADLTGPTACEVITPAEKAAVEARLGPDPIQSDGGRASLAAAARADFVARVRRSRVAVGQQLMDQGVVAGVGNIYRAESLFRARLDPLRPGRDVDVETLGALWDDLVALMRDGAATGAIVTTRPEDRGPAGAGPDDAGVDAAGPEAAGGAGPDGPGRRRRTRQNTDGTPGAVPSDRAFYVYHRDGLPCRVCGASVLLKELAGRNLFWCGVCQT
ncbi:Fpg/Nei family DNA glycosylase [Xylanimonas sp. McL0601]|uniref:Fpg/Nei family DNA glycosylase n=1 Tax=Xylanimonas sp. McL0601 TaxID=3414739 RepID=UPI003CF3BA96